MTNDRVHQIWTSAIDDARDGDEARLRNLMYSAPALPVDVLIEVAELIETRRQEAYRRNAESN